jgi:DHHC palmitoyltransferase
MERVTVCDPNHWTVLPANLAHGSPCTHYTLFSKSHYQDVEAGEGGWFWNEQVGSYRPPGALYCRECGVLIQEYDHLCPWTGTGIGSR